MELVSKLKFDLWTAVITVLVMPLAVFILRMALKLAKDYGGYALEGGEYWLRRVLKRSLAHTLTLKRYCRLQMGEERYKYMKVPSRYDVQLNVDEAYITLSMERHGPTQAVFSHSNILEVGNRIRIVGDPGSGKSSLVKRMFRDTCQKSIRSRAKSRIPIILELKTISIPVDTLDPGEWLYTHTRDTALRCEVYQMGECFDSYVETQGLLLLLDGLDEVATSSYPAVERAIIGLSDILAKKSENNVIILTMRTQFHEQIRPAYEAVMPNVLFLKPFTATDIYEFLSRWQYKEKREENITRIYAELTDRPTLREMCSNPLVLSMYVAEDQATGGAIAPETRTEFYGTVTEELIIRRRQTQLGPAQARTKLREQRERILGRLAYEHLLNAEQPANSLSWDAAIRVVQDVMGCSKSEAEAQFRELGKETGLITEERPQQTFRFIHLTFCEYLAAHEAVHGQRSGWENIVAAHQRFVTQRQLRTRLVEVIPFACGLIPRVARDAAMDDLVRLNDNRLLGRSFLETKQYTHPGWVHYLNEESSRLMNTVEDDWDAAWLQDLYLFNVVVRDAEQCALHERIDTPVDMENLFRKLVNKQRSNIAKLLNACASQDAAVAFRIAELCGLDLLVDFPDIIVSNCDQAPFFALVREKAVGDIPRICLWARLFCEAALRSRVVARSLASAPALPELEDVVKRCYQNRHPQYGLRGQYYQYYLIAKASEDDGLVYETAMLDIVNSLQSYLPYPMFWRIAALSFVIVMICFGGLTYLPAIKPYGKLISQAAGVLWGSCMYYIQFRCMFTAIAYRNIFNIVGLDIVRRNWGFSERAAMTVVRCIAPMGWRCVDKKVHEIGKSIMALRDNTYTDEVIDAVDGAR